MLQNPETTRLGLEVSNFTEISQMFHVVPCKDRDVTVVNLILWVSDFSKYDGKIFYCLVNKSPDDMCIGEFIGAGNGLAPFIVGVCGSYLKSVIFRTDFINFFMNFNLEQFIWNCLSGECHRTPLMFSQNWFRQWLGATRQHAITWVNVDPGLLYVTMWQY